MSPREEQAVGVTRSQIAATHRVVEWYLGNYFRTPFDSGVLARFCERERVGSFAVDRDAIAAGDPHHLFRLLVAVTVFQRRQDAQIERVLLGIPEEVAKELTDQERLLKMAISTSCEGIRSTVALRELCDLSKDAMGNGTCARNPRLDCRLKRHTVHLKRYGHFGKVPTSAAWAVREASCGDLADLYRRAVAGSRRRRERSVDLETALCKGWRISDKIAAMFLSLVANPDLSRGASPWAKGLDWRRFVVIDSNVDLFLASVGYQGAGTYQARREFVEVLASHVSLRTIDRSLHDYNPRLVQQAMYMFMSRSNRLRAQTDCSKRQPTRCNRCSSVLVRRCTFSPGRSD